MTKTDVMMFTGGDNDFSPQAGDYQAWYVPQVPMPSFKVTVPRNAGVWQKLTDLEVAEVAAEVLNVLAAFSQFEFENRVKPDYSDAGGVTRLWELDDPVEVDFECDFDHTGAFLP